MKEKALDRIIDNNDVFHGSALFKDLQILDIDLILHRVEAVLKGEHMIKVSSARLVIGKSSLSGRVSILVDTLCESLCVRGSSACVKYEFKVLFEDIQELKEEWTI